MNKLFESKALKYGRSNELLISSNEMEEDQSEFYDNNLEYVTDITITIPTEEILQSPENIPPETDLDEPTFEILRGDEAENNILPTVSATIEEVPTHKYSTRSSARGSRMRWDPNTHQLIGATEDVMAI